MEAENKWPRTRANRARESWTEAEILEFLVPYKDVVEQAVKYKTDLGKIADSAARTAFYIMANEHAKNEAAPSMRSLFNAVGLDPEGFYSWRYQSGIRAKKRRSIPIAARDGKKTYLQTFDFPQGEAQAAAPAPAPKILAIPRPQSSADKVLILIADKGSIAETLSGLKDFFSKE